MLNITPLWVYLGRGGSRGTAITELAFSVPRACAKGSGKAELGSPLPPGRQREQAVIMSVFTVAEELLTASNCRQQAGVSGGRERGRERGLAVIRGCQRSPRPGTCPAAAPLACAPALPQPSPCPLQSPRVFVCVCSLLGRARSQAEGHWASKSVGFCGGFLEPWLSAARGSGEAVTLVSPLRISSSACLLLRNALHVARVEIPKRKHVYV